MCVPFLTELTAMVSAVKPPFVFVHGGWHNSGIWQFVVPALELQGHFARTLDLPGAGKYVQPPQSYLRRPLQMEMFAPDDSLSANITHPHPTPPLVSLIL